MSPTPAGDHVVFGEILGEMGCFDNYTGVQVVERMVAGEGFEPPTFGL
jgi:hypothetical protein